MTLRPSTARATLRRRLGLTPLPEPTLRQELGESAYRELVFAWSTRHVDRSFFLTISVPDDIEEPYRPRSTFDAGV